MNIIDKIDRLTVKAKEKVGWTRNFGLIICDTLEDVEEKTAEFNDRYGEGIWNAVFVYGADDLEEAGSDYKPLKRWDNPEEMDPEESEPMEAFETPSKLPTAPQVAEKEPDIDLFTSYRNALQKAAQARRLARMGDAARYEEEAWELERLLHKTGLMEVYKEWADTV